MVGISSGREEADSHIDRTQPEAGSVHADQGAAFDVATARVADLYDRVARVYDWFLAPLEWCGGSKRRARILRGAAGDVLDLGIGTGYSLSLYPSGIRLTAIDVSERMLERARARASRAHRSVLFWRASVERLPFDNESFDTVTATYLWGTVSSPAVGLEEVARVLRSGGQFRMLELEGPRLPGVRLLSRWLLQLPRAVLGQPPAEDIVDDLQEAGFTILRIRRSGVWREVIAHA